MKVMLCVVDADVPFLCGKRTNELWRSQLDMDRKVFEINFVGARREIKLINTKGNHYVAVLEMRKTSECLLLGGSGRKAPTYEAVKKVYMVNNPKKQKQLLTARRTTGWVSPDLT